MTMHVHPLAIMALCAMTSACRSVGKPVAASSPAQAAAPEHVVSVQLSFPSESLEPVLFPSLGLALDAEAVAVCARNAAAIRAAGAENIYMVIAGHTDAYGDAAYNVRLSRQRANAVLSEYHRLGLPMAGVEIQAAGGERPLCRERKPACSRWNRRVETTILTMKMQEEVSVP